jgi:hypothetical protein
MPRSSSGHSNRKTARKPLTREMLLPLPVGTAREASLENHLWRLGPCGASGLGCSLFFGGTRSAGKQARSCGGTLKNAGP